MTKRHGAKLKHINDGRKHAVPIKNSPTAKEFRLVLCKKAGKYRYKFPAETKSPKVRLSCEPAIIKTAQLSHHNELAEQAVVAIFQSRTV